MNNKNILSLRWEMGFKIVFWLTMVAAVLVRLPFLGADRMWPDEALYAWYARQIFLHPQFLFSGEISQFHPPLFAFLMSLGHFLFSSEMACRVVVMLINILGVAGVFFLGNKIKGPFVGCAAAILLSFNPLYLNQSFHILIDGAMCLGIVLVLLSLTDISSPRMLRVCLSACALVLLKWPGALVIPFLIFYFGLTAQGSTFVSRVGKGKVPIIAGVVLAAILLLINGLKFGHFLPDTSALGGIYLAKPFWYYVSKFHNIIMAVFLIPFFIYGLYLSLFRQESRGLAAALWFLIYLAAISWTSEKDLRYALPLLPSIMLLSVLGLDVLLGKIVRDVNLQNAVKIAVLILLGLFFVLQFPKISRFLTTDASQFSGYRETGHLIQEHFKTDPQAMVVTTSVRAVQYYADINASDNLKRIVSTPQTKEAFLGFVKAAPQSLVVVVDYWERTQPAWIFPVTPEVLMTFKEAGFDGPKEIQKEVVQKDGTKRLKTVQWIFIRPNQEVKI